MIATTRALVVLITIGILLLHQNQAVELAFSAITFPPVPSFEASTSAARLCIDKVNEGYFEDIKLSTNITLNIKVNPNVVAKAISDTIEFAEEGHTLIGGYSTSGHAVAAGYLGITYGIAQLTDVAAASSLSNKNVYPYVSRSAPSNFLFTEAVKQAILHYGKIEDGWDNLAILSRADTFSIDIAITLINNVESDNEISVTTFQQFLLGSLEIDIELEEIKSSKSRLIFAVVFTEWPFIMEQADKFGLIGDNYVWIATSITLGFPLVNNTLSRGALGVNFLPIVESKAYQDFLTIWNSADPEIYPFAGADASFNSFQLLSYDGMLVCARAMAEADRRGILRADLPPETWTELIRGLVFEGATGPVSFDENSDRLMDIGIFYYSPEASDWVPSAIYSEEAGYNVFEPVVWHSNTTIVPDLDIREPRRYWSCHDKESRVDKTGKTVIIHTPDGSDIDDIDIDYYCDSFIDCKNMSDESEDCSTNYKIVFIVFGIVAGVLILIAVALIVFVIIFGIILKYRRVRQLSPFFMLLVLVSVIIGYSSTYAWFGKPHPVGCAFQPWLLGLSSISMIAALSVKNFRIWRIFRFPMNKLKISDFELLTYWSIIMFPAVLLLIIWTIISTPTAKMQDRGDNDHYVCATGGFAGEYGGVVFFSILVAYSAFVLIVGAFVSFAIRNVPSRFNESKLLTISIYNLGFLAAVIIPVFLVVHPINPFIAWILRTCAILYAFTATMVLQFGPLLWGIFISDKGKNIRTFKTGLTTTNYSKKPDSESLSPRESGASSQNSVASIGT